MIITVFQTATEAHHGQHLGPPGHLHHVRHGAQSLPREVPRFKPRSSGLLSIEMAIIDFSSFGLEVISYGTDNVSVHCREEGCIGKYTPRGPRDFPRAGILHPEAREIARGRSPRAISRAEGCKINAEANLEVRGGRNFQWIPTLVSVITFFFPRRGCFDFSFWPAHCVL